MDRIRPRSATVFLLAAVLLLTATPIAGAAPMARTAGEPDGVTAFFGAWTTWLTALWPGGPEAGIEKGAAPTADLERGSGLDPNGVANTSEEATYDPTSDPERGSGLDPDG